MPVTIRDITKRLDVSGSAVSSALHEYTDITDDTRQRILGADQTADRLAGFHLGIMQANLPLDPERVIVSDLTSAGGYNATKRLLSIPDPPDATLCVIDQTAFGAMQAIDEAGLKTGQDSAVAGFDGVRDARFSNPPLTTLDQPADDIARQPVRLLAAGINGQAFPNDRVVLQPTLLIRASAGCSSDTGET